MSVVDTVKLLGQRTQKAASLISILRKEKAALAQQLQEAEGRPVADPETERKLAESEAKNVTLNASLTEAEGKLEDLVAQLADLQTAVSEAVTNCIVHAYPDRVGPIVMTLAVYPGRLVKITVADRGVGIPDIPKAMEPLFTTGNPEERSGLGFAVMQSFMDKVRVSSTPGHGTRVTLTKRLEEKPST